MITTTMDGVAGRVIAETKGVVRGTALWTRRITKTSMGGIRHMQANSMKDLDEGLNAAKEQVTKTVKDEAAKLGADAVVGLRLDVTEMSNGVFCVSACGTAVATARLPDVVPALPPVAAADPLNAPAEDFDFGLVMFAARASAEGSALRH